jgi:hypothetical protein
MSFRANRPLLGVVYLVLIAGCTRYEPIFDGKTLDGWRVSAASGHSRTSGNKSGGKWVVEDGAIVGTQDVPGNGGILVTEKEYGDFEVVLEMRNDFGPDSGLFMRSNEKGQAYQYLVDYHRDGSLAGLYGEGLRPGFHLRNFSFGENPETIVEVTNAGAPTPLPVKPDAWPKFWKHGEWNELKARIEGNPPKITTWINGVKFMEWQDTEKRTPDKGLIALQVHGGGDYTNQYVRYRNIRVRELEKGKE